MAHSNTFEHRFKVKKKTKPKIEKIEVMRIKVKVGKTYLSKDKRKIKILHISRGGAYPITGIIHCNDHSLGAFWAGRNWNWQGQCHDGLKKRGANSQLMMP